MEERDDFEVALRRSHKRRKGVVAALGVLALAGIAYLVGRPLWQRYQEETYEAPRHALTAEQRETLRARIEASRKAIAEKDGKWRPAIVEVTGEGPCTALEHHRSTLEGNPQASSFGGWDLLDKPFEWTGSSIASLSRTPFPLRVVKAVPEHSPEASIRLRDLDRMQADLGEATYQTFEDRLEDASIEKLYTTDVLVVLDVVKEAELGVQDRFKPGAAIGRAWVYDHEADRLVCAGSVSAVSSSTVDPGTTNLGDDLLTNLVRAIPDGVKRVGP